MKKLLFLLAVVISSFAATAYSATTYYEIWRNTSNAPGTATKIKEWLIETSCDDTTVIPGVHYYYWIRATSCDYIETSGYVGSTGLGYTLNMLYPKYATAGYISPFKLFANISGSYFESTDEELEFFIAEMDNLSYDVIGPSWPDYFDGNPISQALGLRDGNYNRLDIPLVEKISTNRHYKSSQRLVNSIRNYRYGKDANSEIDITDGDALGHYMFISQMKCFIQILLQK